MYVKNKLSMEGTIDFSGTDATKADRGGGSGGSVSLTANEIVGTGNITVAGGSGKKSMGGGGSGGYLTLVATIIQEGQLQRNCGPGQGFQANSGGKFEISKTVGVGNCTLVATELLPAAIFETCCSCAAIDLLRVRESTMTSDLNLLGNGIVTCRQEDFKQEIVIEKKSSASCVTRQEQVISLAVVPDEMRAVAAAKMKACLTEPDCMQPRISTTSFSFGVTLPPATVRRTVTTFTLQSSASSIESWGRYIGFMHNETSEWHECGEILEEIGDCVQATKHVERLMLPPILLNAINANIKFQMNVSLTTLGNDITYETWMELGTSGGDAVNTTIMEWFSNDQSTYSVLLVTADGLTIHVTYEMISNVYVVLHEMISTAPRLEFNDGIAPPRVHVSVTRSFRTTIFSFNGVPQGVFQHQTIQSLSSSCTFSIGGRPLLSSGLNFHQTFITRQFVGAFIHFAVGRTSHLQNVDYSVVPSSTTYEPLPTWNVQLNVVMESVNIKIINVFRSKLEIQALKYTMIGGPIHHSFTEMTHTFQTSFIWSLGGTNTIEHMRKNRVLFSIMLRDAWIASMAPLSRQNIIVRFLSIKNDGSIEVEIGCVDQSLSVFLRNNILQWTTNATLLTQMMEPLILARFPGVVSNFTSSIAVYPSSVIDAKALLEKSKFHEIRDTLHQILFERLKETACDGGSVFVACSSSEDYVRYEDIEVLLAEGGMPTRDIDQMNILVRVMTSDGPHASIIESSLTEMTEIDNAANFLSKLLADGAGWSMRSVVSQVLPVTLTRETMSFITTLWPVSNLEISFVWMLTVVDINVIQHDVFQNVVASRLNLPISCVHITVTLSNTVVSSVDVSFVVNPSKVPDHWSNINGSYADLAVLANRLGTTDAALLREDFQKLGQNVDAFLVTSKDGWINVIEDTIEMTSYVSVRLAMNFLIQVSIWMSQDIAIKQIWSSYLGVTGLVVSDVTYESNGRFVIISCSNHPSDMGDYITSRLDSLTSR